MVCMAWQLQVLKVNCFNPLQCSSNCLAWPRWLGWQAWILRLFFLGPSSSLPAGVVVRPWKVRNARGEECEVEVEVKMRQSSRQKLHLVVEGGI